MAIPSQWLNAGQSWTFGNARMTMQTDGNLVIYTRNTNQARWSTGTHGSGGNRVRFQGDGNFVVYSAANRAVWSSHTAGTCSGFFGAPQVMIGLQSDSNFVIYCRYTPFGTALEQYAVRWATGTRGI
jgi:hypothetical protein